MCGCSGSAEVSQADSPALQSCESYGICEGGEQDQYIIAELIFDRPVSFSEELKEQLRVVIGGQRIAPEKIEVGAVENREDAVQLKMAVQQVNDGYLEITNAPGEEKADSSHRCGGQVLCGFRGCEAADPKRCSHYHSEK